MVTVLMTDSKLFGYQLMVCHPQPLYFPITKHCSAIPIQYATLHFGMVGVISGSVE